jgi:uncharacterized protein YodC (DUF2158 family)
MKIGDTVKLNDGGPSMTILTIDEKEAECLWFSSDDQLQTAIFPLGIIDLVKKEFPYTPKSGIGRL